MNYEDKDILNIAQKALERASKKADNVYELCFEEEGHKVLVKRFWLKGKRTEYLGELYFPSLERVLATGYATSPALLRKMLGCIKQLVSAHLAHGESVCIRGLNYFSGFYLDGVLKFEEVVHSSSGNIEGLFEVA